MAENQRKLGEAELQIMRILWESDKPMTSNDILTELHDSRQWQLSTLMTSLKRLSDKGFVHCDRSTRNNLYSAIVSENDYKAVASRHFLSQLYDNSLRNMIATLYESKEIKHSDISELRSFLDKLEDEL